MTQGIIERVSGPIVFAKGLEGSGLYDVVNVGQKKLMGENDSGLRGRDRP